MKIAITGEFRRGKSTVGNMLSRMLKHDRPVTQLAFADALKEELSTMVFSALLPTELTLVKDGITFAKPGAYKEWDRRMRAQRSVNGVGWQWWGEYRRQFHGEDYWIQHSDFQHAYKAADKNGDHIILTDVRHHNEADWCNTEGFFLLRVVGPCRAEESRDPNHPSEIHVRALPVNFELINDGTMNDLTKAVTALLTGELVEFFDSRDRVA